MNASSRPSILTSLREWEDHRTYNRTFSLIGLSCRVILWRRLLGSSVGADSIPLDYNLKEPAYDTQRGVMGLPDGENLTASIKPAFTDTSQRLRNVTARLLDQIIGSKSFG